MHSAASPSTLIERFADWIAWTCRRVVQRQVRLPLPPGGGGLGREACPERAGLAISRLQKIKLRFTELVARYRAGRLRPRRVLGPRGPLAARRAARPLPDPDVPVLTRRFGWLNEVAPGAGGEEVAKIVTTMLEDPEAKEMIAVAPDVVRRVVSPLYWALGGHLPEHMRPATKPGAKPRRLPMTRSLKEAMRAGRRIHAAYLRAKQAEEALGAPPKAPPPPYGFATEADTYINPVQYSNEPAHTFIRRR
jgi:hypothetical protein